MSRDFAPEERLRAASDALAGKWIIERTRSLTPEIGWADVILNPAKQMA